MRYNSDQGLSNLYLSLIVTLDIFCDLPVFYSVNITVLMLVYNQVTQHKDNTPYVAIHWERGCEDDPQ